jgi:hypothetical protein
LPLTLCAQQDDRGTLRGINEHPLETPLLSWHLLDTRLVQQHKWRWTVNLAYSNIFKHDSVGRSEVYIDSEPLRLNFAASYGFAPKWDAEVQVSAFRHSGGFMDAFIRRFENAFGVPTRGSQSGVNNQFRLLLIRDDTAIVDHSGSMTGFGDTRILVRRSLSAREGLSICAVGALKLPTGTKFFGGDGPDAGLGIVAKYAHGRWRLRSELDALFTSSFLGLPAKNRADLKCGVEYMRSKISFMLQTDFRSHAFTWGKNTLDDPPMQAYMGIKFAGPSRLVHQIYVAEDLSRQTPDVTFGYAMEW